MTDKIFDLQIKLVADDDRGRKEDRMLLEKLLAEALRNVIPEAIILSVNMKERKK